MRNAPPPQGPNRQARRRRPAAELGPGSWPAPVLGPGRASRRWQALLRWLGLVLAVVVAHAWVLAGLQTGAQRVAARAVPWPHQAPGAGAPLQVRLVVARRMALEADAPAAAARLAPGAAPVAQTPARSKTHPGPGPRPAARAAGADAPVPAPLPAAATAAVAGVGAGAGVGVAVAAPGVAAGADHTAATSNTAKAANAAKTADAASKVTTADTTEAATAPASEMAQAPPRYPTRLPDNALAVYRLNYLGRHSLVSLLWQREAAHYRLLLDSARPGEHPVMAQHSLGEVGDYGLAPTRFVDRRRGRGARAANFRRAQAVVSFSASEALLPAWPGAQDRLSWLIQLTGVLQAAVESGTPLAEVRLWVVDARGTGSLWRLVDDGARHLTLPSGEALGHCWRHAAERPDDLQVEVCLDASRQHWPLRLRYTLPRSAAVIEWLLHDGPDPA